MQMISHGRKNKQKHCHGRTRNNTERKPRRSERLTMEGRTSIATDEHGKDTEIKQIIQSRLHSSLRCKIQRFKWSSCSGASPSQLLCLKTSPNQIMGSNRKNKKKEQGEHQRIYIRRSIKKVGLKGLNKSGEK